MELDCKVASGLLEGKSLSGGSLPGRAIPSHSGQESSSAQSGPS